MLAFNEVANSVDNVLLWVAYLSPIVAVCALNKRPILVGTVLAWGALVLAGIALSVLDPRSRDGFTSFFDQLWLAVGWIPALAYCWVIYGAKVAIVRIWSGRRDADVQPPASALPFTTPVKLDYQTAVRQPRRTDWVRVAALVAILLMVLLWALVA